MPRYLHGGIHLVGKYPCLGPHGHTVSQNEKEKREKVNQNQRIHNPDQMVQVIVAHIEALCTSIDTGAPSQVTGLQCNSAGHDRKSAAAKQFGGRERQK